MSTSLKPYDVRLIVRSFYHGTVQANSAEEAEARTFEIWRTECPHPFERCDDDELISVEAKEVRPVPLSTSDTRLSDIAKTSLGIVTLETRGADSLDFHTVSVWQVTQSLQQALDVGAVARNELIAAIEDLLGDQPDICSGRCIRCGRDYAADTEPSGLRCPSEACPSFKARTLLHRMKAGAP